MIGLFFSRDNMPEVTDPWGTVTIVVPHLKMESIHALSRLLYCGNSGNLSNVIMEEILNYVRPEFGGFKHNQKPISKPLKDPNEITKKSSKLQEKPMTSLNQNSSPMTQMNKPAENTRAKVPPITETSVKSNTQMPINQLLEFCGYENSGHFIFCVFSVILPLHAYSFS